MELIPLIKKMGYQYVLVDSNNVEAVTDMSWAELRYRPHVAKFGGDEIIVVVRDRDLSDAQESGMDVGWFLSEVEARTKDCDFVPLVTTCTDGDNGGWFRNTTENSNYWDCFYEKLLQNSSNGNVEVEPIFIKDYLKDNEPFGEVRIDTAAWNTGWHRTHRILLIWRDHLRKSKQSWYRRGRHIPIPLQWADDRNVQSAR